MEVHHLVGDGREWRDLVVQEQESPRQREAVRGLGDGLRAGRGEVEGR